MNRINLRGRAPLVSLLAMATLAACGGGGDGGSESAPTPAPATAMALTASNYQAVTEQAIRAGSYLANSGELLSGAQAGVAPSVLNSAVKQLPGLLKQFQKPALLAGAVINETTNCSGGGKIESSFTDSNNNSQPDEGESLVMVADACIEDGETIAGRVEIKLSKLTGIFDSNNYSAVITMKLEAFSVSSASAKASGTGELKVTMGAASASQSSLQIEAPNFSASGRIGTVDYQQTMSNFVIATTTVTESNGQSTDTAKLSGTLSGSALDGKSISLETPTALIFSSALSYPSAGKLLIKGAANSLVQMTVQANGRVLIELDADGNGSFETSSTKSWSELD